MTVSMDGVKNLDNIDDNFFLFAPRDSFFCPFPLCLSFFDLMDGLTYIEMLFRTLFTPSLAFVKQDKDF